MLKQIFQIIFIFAAALQLFCCSPDKQKSNGSADDPDKHQPTQNTEISGRDLNTEAPEGMAYIPAGTFIMGSNDAKANRAEGPEYKAKLHAFYMDKTEVTNGEFRKFIEETGYSTVAERKVDWAELKQQVPAGTPKPPDSLLKPGSLVFYPGQNVNLHDVSQWWKWKIGADWRHPYGPESEIEGLDDHPVVHIAFEDAKAYANWAGKRLPTEAEWEYASRGGGPHSSFAWGNKLTPDGKYLANFYQGTFPDNNAEKDGFVKTAPVKSFSANGFGLYDMIGNVWEWTSDYYRPDTHSRNKTGSVKACFNPTGPSKSYDPREPLIPKRVTKGGSYLCSAEYCSNYRPSARMATAFDSGQEHLGFRCVADVE